MNTINLNGTVRVCLNDHGRARLSEYVDGLGFESTLFDAKLAAAVTEWQLWELAHVFGRWMYNGAPPLFDTTRLEVVPSEIDKQIEDATTVEARILVRVDVDDNGDASWAAAGWDGEAEANEKSMRETITEIQAESDDAGKHPRWSWVTARVPKPVTAEVEGTVEP